MKCIFIWWRHRIVNWIAQLNVYIKAYFPNKHANCIFEFISCIMCTFTVLIPSGLLFLKIVFLKSLILIHWYKCKWFHCFIFQYCWPIAHKKWENPWKLDKRYYQQIRAIYVSMGFDQNQLCLELHIIGSKHIYF